MAEPPADGTRQGNAAMSTLKRSRSDRWLLGVAGGFAAHFHTPGWLVRLIWIVSVPVTLGLSVIAYLVLAAVLPVEDGEAAGDRAGDR